MDNLQNCIILTDVSGKFRTNAMSAIFNIGFSTCIFVYSPLTPNRLWWDKVTLHTSSCSNMFEKSKPLKCHPWQFTINNQLTHDSQELILSQHAWNEEVYSYFWLLQVHSKEWCRRWYYIKCWITNHDSSN